MTNWAEKVISILVGAVITLGGFIISDKLGYLDNTSSSVEQTKQEMHNSDKEFLEKMMTMQSNIDSKLSTLSVEVSKYAGDMKALQITIESYNRNSEKDIARLSTDLKNFALASERRMNSMEKKLEADDVRIKNIESYLKSFGRKRGFEFLNFNI